MRAFSTSRLFSSGAVVFAGLLAGRALGFGREVLFASRFGISQDADAAALLLTIPDTMVRILIGGAIAAVLIPELQRTNRTEAVRLYGSAVLVFGGLAAAAALILAATAEPVVQLFAPGLDNAVAATTASVVRWSLWVLPLAAVAAVAAARLQAAHRFALVAAGTSIMNLGIIGALLVSAQLSTLALGMVVGAAVRACVQLGRAQPWCRLPQRPISTKPARTLLPRYGLVLAAAGGGFLVPVVVRAMASLHGEGSLAAVGYAYRLVELPAGLLFSVVSVVLLPTLAALQGQQAHKVATKAVGLVLALSLVAAATLFVLSGWVGEVVYGHGVMTQRGVELVEGLTRRWSLALPAMGVTAVCQAIFYARRDVVRPLVTGGTTVVLLVACAGLTVHTSIATVITGVVIVQWVAAALSLALVQTEFRKDES